ncbi:MAG TPA: prepilin-type N-terminal cleavage/methylation domain-containing protein [Thermoanaerobaculia bacterium]|nr:prepilin-type N-terminal cleavage/methylation domain-containing protein [Thermoanaerobaculia bacterium]
MPRRLRLGKDRWPAAARSRGFSLVEALVALALAAAVLLAGNAIHGVEGRARRRGTAHRAAEALLAETYESVRGGLQPLRASRTRLPAGSGLEGFLRIGVENERADGLVRLELEIAYDAAGASARRRLVALVWVP